MIAVNESNIGFMSNIKMSKKLLLLIVVPFIALLWQSAHVIIDSYTAYNSAIVTEKTMSAVSSASEFLHNMQKERGLSAIYISTKDPQKKQELMSVRQSTDKAFLSYKEFVFANKEYFSEKMNSLFSETQSIASEITRIRADTESETAVASDVIKAYTTLTQKILNTILVCKTPNDQIFYSLVLHSLI